MRDFAWTDERIAKLKVLWAEGLSCSQIEAKLGAPSRSAVIGKVHRLGLPGRKTVIRKARLSGAPHSRVKRAPKQLLKTKALPIPQPEDIARVSLLDLEPHHCRWPAGDPVQGFCGCPKVPGLPYCEGHAKRAFLPAPAYRPTHRKAERRTERPTVERVTA